MIEKIESQISASRKYFTEALRGSDDEQPFAHNPTKKNVKLEIPAAIRDIPPVFNIVQKCLSPDPGKTSDCGEVVPDVASGMSEEDPWDGVEGYGKNVRPFLLYLLYLLSCVLMLIGCRIENMLRRVLP